MYKSITFSTNGLIPQCFSFPADVMKLIIENISSPKLYQNLIKSCKYFYTKKEIVVYNYHIRDDTMALLEKLLSHKIKVWLYLDFQYISPESSRISNLIPQIYRCHLEIIYLMNQKLRYDEYLFFASPGTLKYVTLSYTKILDKYDLYVPFEEIMECLPNVVNFNFLPGHGSYYTVETAKCLMKLPKFKNLMLLKLTQITELFDYNCFCHFIKKNQISQIFLSFKFHNVPKRYKHEFKSAVDAIINENISNGFNPKIIFANS